MFDLHFELDCICILYINTDFICHADIFHKLQQLKQLSGREFIQGGEKTMTFMLTVCYSDFGNKDKS